MSTDLDVRNAALMSALEARALDELGAYLPDAIQLRHRIHADPRLGGDEYDTRDQVVRALGLSGGENVYEGYVVRVGEPTGPVIAIRAELDGLPIQETSGVQWASTRPGVSHLCGHDVHAAALTAATKVIASLGSPVPLLAVFQPREESFPSGAADFVAADALRNHEIAALIGVHLQPGIPKGSASAAAGAVNASADNFDILVHGRPAHGAYPHLSRDPILAAAAVIQGLQQLVSRRIDPMRPAVVTVGRVSGGDSHNAIPAQVLLQGTIRSYSKADRDLLHEEVRRISESVSTAFGCTASVVIQLGEPILENDEQLARLTSSRLVVNGFRETAPIRSCGADDFAFFSAQLPALMVFAGVGDGDPNSPGLHHPAFVPDDSSVEEVARIMLLGYFAAANALAVA